jgi:hypothetical protein
MAFVGKNLESETLLYFDRGKLKSDKRDRLINMQAAYGGGRHVQLNPGDGIVFEGSTDGDGAKIELIHNSSYETSEGIRFTTSTGATDSWTALAAYDSEGLQVISLGVDSERGVIAVRSTEADGKSGYQFINDPGTLIAIDSSAGSLVLQKNSGYIDFKGYGNSLPTLRIDPNAEYPTVSVGRSGSEHMLLVNGIDITPYSGSVVVPAGSTSIYPIIELYRHIEEDTFGMFNIDVFAGTLSGNSEPSLASSSTAAWKLFVTINKKSLDQSGISVVGVTQIESHRFVGENSQDDPVNWDVDVTTGGVLQVSTQKYNSLQDITFGAVITKLSVLDTQTGHMIR